MRLWFRINMAWQICYILVTNLFSQALKSILLSPFFSNPHIYLPTFPTSTSQSNRNYPTYIIPPQIYKLLFPIKGGLFQHLLKSNHAHNYRIFMLLFFPFTSVSPILLCLFYLYHHSLNMVKMFTPWKMSSFDLFTQYSINYVFH